MNRGTTILQLTCHIRFIYTCKCESSLEKNDTCKKKKTCTCSRHIAYGGILLIIPSSQSG